MNIDFKNISRFIQAPEGYVFELINTHHTPSIITWRNNPELNQYFLLSQNLTLESQKQFLKEYESKDRVDFVLLDQSINLPIGVFSIKNLSTEPEIGQLIGESTYRGKGLGKAATLSLLAFAFNYLELEAIYARIKKLNTVNINLTKKLNFQLLKYETHQNESISVMKLTRFSFDKISG